MRFFLVGSDPVSGSLRLITDTVFPSRRDALAFLSSDTAAPALARLDEEVFVVDLETATPVLLVQQGTGASEQAEEGAEEPHAAVEAVEAEIGEAGPEEPAEADPGLASALRRATGTLESEGIVAPESIGPEVVVASAAYPTPFVPEPAAWPWDSSSAEGEAEDAEVRVETQAEAAEMPAPAEEGEPDEALVAVEDAELDEEILAISAADAELDAAGEDEPAEDAETIPVAEDAPEPVSPEETAPAEEADEASYAFDALEEPSVDDAGLVPEAADAVYGRAVVMGEYDVPDAPVEPMGANGGDAGIAAEIGDSEDAEPVEDDAVADVAAEAAEIPDDSDASPVELVVAEEGAEADAAGAEDGADEAGYTCDDCVYVNTCPKHHESDPTACGSFQWKIA